MHPTNLMPQQFANMVPSFPDVETYDGNSVPPMPMMVSALGDISLQGQAPPPFQNSLQLQGLTEPYKQPGIVVTQNGRVRETLPSSPRSLRAFSSVSGATSSVVDHGWNLNIPDEWLRSSTSESGKQAAGGLGGSARAAGVVLGDVNRGENFFEGSSSDRVVDTDEGWAFVFPDEAGAGSSFRSPSGEEEVQEGTKKESKALPISVYEDVWHGSFDDSDSVLSSLGEASDMF